MPLKILIAAGGSGGHLFPAQAIARLLVQDCEVFFAGHDLKKSPFFTKGKIAFAEISSSQPKRGNWLSFIFKSSRGFFQSLFLIFRFSPDVVVGFGSYHSFPVLLASVVFRKKIVLFEANSVLGKVNRLFSFSAKKIGLQFPLPKPLKNAVFVPYLPWGKENKALISREEALNYFGLRPDRITVLIFGGSQGAKFLNDAIPHAVKKIPQLQAIHFAGRGGSAFYDDFPACVKEFEENMHLAYLAADLVICRSGAGTVAELICYQKPSLLIPFPYSAENHQWKNGEFLAHTVKGALLLSQRDATLNRMESEISVLIERREEFKMALKNWHQQTSQTKNFDALIREVGESK